MIYADNKMLVLHLALNLQHDLFFFFRSIPVGGGGGNSKLYFCPSKSSLD